MATTKKQRAEETLKFYLRQVATCHKAGNERGASLWSENFIGALTIYKIFTGATDQEIRDTLYPNK